MGAGKYACVDAGAGRVAGVGTEATVGCAVANPDGAPVGATLGTDLGVGVTGGELAVTTSGRDWGSGAAVEIGTSVAVVSMLPAGAG